MLGAEKKQVKLALLVLAVSVLLLPVLLLSLSSCIEDRVDSPILIVTPSEKVLRVFSEGKIEILRDPPPQPRASLAGYGTTSPVPPPDHQFVAFTRDNDLWLLHVETNKETRATWVGKPETETHASIFVYITAWDGESRQVLYAVEHGQTYDFEGRTPTLQVRPANYGFFIYDLNAHTSRTVRIPGEFMAWLPGGEFLLVPATGKPMQQQLFRYKPGDDTKKPVLPLRGWYLQMDASRDGQWLVVSVAQKVSNESKVQMLKINLKNDEVKPVTPLGKWAEYQRPRLSPSGDRLAYLWQKGLDVSRYPKATLVVEDKSIYAFIGYADYRWVDDQSIVFWQRRLPGVGGKKASESPEEVIVLNANTGQVKGKRIL